jgi:hypothetical protein
MGLGGERGTGDRLEHALGREDVHAARSEEGNPAG